MQEPGISYEGVDVANHTIFVGLHASGLGAYTYDAATGFTRAGILEGFTNAWGVAARDNHVFVADGVDGLVTVDASDPTQMIELGALLVFGVAVVSLILVAGLVLKTILWVLLLPFRLVFWLIGSLLILPFLLIKAVVGGLLMLLALPLLVIGLVIGAIAFAAAGPSAP